MLGELKSGPSPALAPLLQPPDRTHVCWGYHASAVTYGKQTHAIKPLLDFSASLASDWHPEPHVHFEYEHAAVAGQEAEKIHIAGTFRHTNCTYSCLSSAGERLSNLMCNACRSIPQIDSFRRLVTRRTALLGRESSRARFDSLTPEKRLAVMRRLAQRVKELTRSQWLLRQLFLRKCARVRGLSERLKENAARGDARAIIEDVIECERSGKFKQKRALLHFVRDMLHSLRLSAAAQPTGAEPT